MSKAATLLSPVAFCTGQIAASASQAAAQRFQQDTIAFATEPLEQQMRFLNRYWRHQLARLQDDTISAREALVDDCPYNEWQQMFTKYILPVVVKYSLPIG
jgi:hypothetical protein